MGSLVYPIGNILFTFQSLSLGSSPGRNDAGSPDTNPMGTWPRAAWWSPLLPGCPGIPLSHTYTHTQGRRASSGAHLDLVGPLASGGGMHEAAMMTQTAQQSNQEEMKETKVWHLSGLACPLGAIACFTFPCRCVCPDKGPNPHLIVLEQWNNPRGDTEGRIQSRPVVWCGRMKACPDPHWGKQTNKNQTLHWGTKASDSKSKKPHSKHPAIWRRRVFPFRGIPQPLPISFRSPRTSHVTTWNSTLQGVSQSMAGWDQENQDYFTDHKGHVGQLLCSFMLDIYWPGVSNDPTPPPPNPRIALRNQYGDDSPLFFTAIKKQNLFGCVIAQDMSWQ